MGIARCAPSAGNGAAIGRRRVGAPNLDAMPGFRSGSQTGATPTEDILMSISTTLTAAVAMAIALLPGATSAAEPPAFADVPRLISKTTARFPAPDKGNRVVRRKDAVLVKLNANASPAQTEALRSLYARYGLRIEKRIVEGSVLRLNISNKNFENQEEAIATQIRATGAVEISEPDYFVPLAFIPNDARYPQQWHHPRINSPAAWDISQGDSGVLVAVCDAGFDLFHPDLHDRYVTPSYNTVYGNSIIDNINDHGTQTSGALAATGNNIQGVTGMTWQNPLLAIQVSNRADGLSTYSDIAECIAHAQSRGARVVNISYDYLYTSATIDLAALNLRNAGGLVVVAAGNSGSDISTWGQSDVLIVAGASNPDDSLTWFSNFGTPVDIYAPGIDIYTTSTGNTYSPVAGTSFATPLVAGTIALLYSLGSQLTPAEVENLLLSNLTRAGDIGRLNAGAALQKAAESMPPPPIEMDNLAANVSDASRISKGKWCVSNDPGHYGGKSLTSCGPKLDTYQLVPTITEAGAYTIYVRYVSRNKLSKQATIKIKDATGTLTKNINMRVNGGTWVALGTFNLGKGTSNYLEINDSSGFVNIDGARFEAAQ